MAIIFEERTPEVQFPCPLSDKDAAKQAQLLYALAHPIRLQILSLLSRYEGDVCVREIVENFTLEQPSISHHLGVLRRARLVDCRTKKGHWNYYHVIPETLARAQEIIDSLA